MEIEFYGYDTQGGVLELDNRPDDPMGHRMLDCVLGVALPTELRHPRAGVISNARPTREILDTGCSAPGAEPGATRPVPS